MGWIIGDWTSLGQVAGKAALKYVTALIGLRLGERRTLAQWTIIDFATAVAMGAVIGRTAIAEAQSYVTGAVALLTLVAVHRAASRLRFNPLLGKLLDHRVRVLVAHGSAARRAPAMRTHRQRPRPGAAAEGRFLHQSDALRAVRDEGQHHARPRGRAERWAARTQGDRVSGQLPLTRWPQVGSSPLACARLPIAADPAPRERRTSPWRASATSWRRAACSTACGR